jgi:Flp pilus assembly protein TadD
LVDGCLQESFSEAERWYRTAVRLEPQDTSTRYNLAALYARQSRFHTAAQVASHALRIKPAEAELRQLLSRVVQAGRAGVRPARRPARASST